VIGEHCSCYSAVAAYGRLLILVLVYPAVVAGAAGNARHLVHFGWLLGAAPSGIRIQHRRVAPELEPIPDAAEAPVDEEPA
jgi:hypothetical protein